jgi:hypothetical protein
MGNYTEEQWSQAQDMIINQPTMPISKIALATGINFNALYSKAKGRNWLAARDLNDHRKASERLLEVVRDITGQITDVHEHTIAMVEALQNTYRIEIYKDAGGHIHYRNMMPQWPGIPPNFDQLTNEAKAVSIQTIDLSRMQSFFADLMSILDLKTRNIEFVTKILKGALPKMDIYELDLSRRAADDTIDVLATPNSKNMLSEIKKQYLQIEGQVEGTDDAQVP